MSESAGIPDLRTEGHCLFDYVIDDCLPFPEALYDRNYFLENPEPLYKIMGPYIDKIKESYPTIAHHFIKLLND